MHGLVNRSIEGFIADTYGRDAWRAVAARANLGFDGFEAMLTYEPELTERVLDAAAAQLGKPREMLLEDIGTYLVSHPKVDSVRRLLRFGGDTFVEFMHSIDQLSDRVRLAVPDLELPDLDLRAYGPANFTLDVRFDRLGYGHVLLGVLRAMADEYGTLVMLDHLGASCGGERLAIVVLDQAFASGRRFDLAASPE